jgi:hypothetical protein
MAAKKKYFTDEERLEASRRDNRKSEEKRRRARGQLLQKKYNSEEERKIARKEQDRKWKINNPSKVKESRAKWLRKNPNYKKEYEINRLKIDINFKLARNLRNRLRVAIYNNQKAGSAVKDLGCSIPELKIHLETQFQPGMTWENWSRTGWHIDHIQPLDSFNLQNREEFLKACHYTNLQPLWAEENLTKSNNIA